VIAFDLQCAAGHLFEGWFEDSAAYRQQREKELIACPVCNDTCVRRVPSTFAIRSSQPAVRPAGDAPADKQVQLAQLGRRLAEYVEANFDDVGADFSREALKIHYGAAEPRSIRGVSTQEEENTLRAEGVQFFKLPLPLQSDPDV
jgi:hypothetical protein